MDKPSCISLKKTGLEETLYFMKTIIAQIEETKDEDLIPFLAAYKEGKLTDSDDKNFWASGVTFTTENALRMRPSRTSGGQYTFKINSFVEEDVVTTKNKAWGKWYGPLITLTPGKYFFNYNFNLKLIFFKFR